MAPPSRSGSRPGPRAGWTGRADLDHADLDPRRPDVQPRQLAQPVQGRPRARPVKRHPGGAQGGDPERRGAVEPARCRRPSGSCSTGSTAPATPGPQVQTQGNDQITVTVPGKAATSVVNLIDTTAYADLPAGAADRAVHRRGDHPRQGQGDRHPVGRRPAGRRAAPPRPTASPTPSVSSSRERHREGVDLRRLRQAGQPDRHPHRHGVGQGDRRHATASSTPKATATADATASANPACHRRDDHHLR